MSDLRVAKFAFFCLTAILNWSAEPALADDLKDKEVEAEWAQLQARSENTSIVWSSDATNFEKLENMLFERKVEFTPLVNKENSKDTSFTVLVMDLPPSQAKDYLTKNGRSAICSSSDAEPNHLQFCRKL